jgi:hypothetical protein
MQVLVACNTVVFTHSVHVLLQVLGMFMDGCGIAVCGGQWQYCPDVPTASCVQAGPNTYAGFLLCGFLLQTLYTVVGVALCNAMWFNVPAALHCVLEARLAGGA